MVSTKTRIVSLGRDAPSKGERCQMFNGRGQAAQELLGEDITVPENVRNYSSNDSHFSAARIFSNTAVRMSVWHCPDTLLTNIPHKHSSQTFLANPPRKPSSQKLLANPTSKPS